MLRGTPGNYKWMELNEPIKAMLLIDRMSLMDFCLQRLCPQSTSPSDFTSDGCVFRVLVSATFVMRCGVSICMITVDNVPDRQQCLNITP